MTVVHNLIESTNCIRSCERISYYILFKSIKVCLEGDSKILEAKIILMKLRNKMSQD